MALATILIAIGVVVLVFVFIGAVIMLMDRYGERAYDVMSDIEDWVSDNQRTVIAGAAAVALTLILLGVVLL